MRFACRITKNAYANASQYYFTRTLPVLFFIVLSNFPVGETEHLKAFNAPVPRRTIRDVPGVQKYAVKELCINITFAMCVGHIKAKD
jgi:hypothetical protein